METYGIVVIEVIESQSLAEMLAKFGPCLLPCEGNDDHRRVVSEQDFPFGVVQWCFLVHEVELVG